MKKNYFMLAAATMMFAACAETDLVNEIAVEETPQAISFETFANKATRADDETPETPATPAEPTAENSTAGYSGDLSSHHESFTVWGYKNVSNDKVFNGVTVSYDDEKQVWDYVTNVVSAVYWDKAASKYEFYAAAPTKADFWTLNPNTAGDQADDYFTTADFTVQSHNAADSYVESSTQSFKQVNNAEDLMIAEKTTVNKPTNSTFSGDVPLNFIHILSRLNVTVKTSIADVTVTKIEVGNINSKGTFSEYVQGLTEASIKAGTTQRWNLVEAITDDAAGTTTPAPVISYINRTSKALTKDANAIIAIEALVMPQIAGTEKIDIDATTFTGKVEPYLYIEYKINNEVYKRAYNLADVFNGETDTTLAFNEGWQNTLNLTIGGDKISFTTSVALWEESATNENGTIK